MNSLWSEHKAPDGRSYFYNATTGESTWDRPADFIPQQPPLPGAGAVAAGGFGGGFGSFAGNRNGFPGDAYGAYGGFGNPYGGPAYGGQQMQHPGPPIQKGKQAQGPPGCNLFVFHIPNNMTTRELYNMFAPFGNVVSARIMVERETGRSRGFGFVSFDNYQSADASIRALDGYQVGPKRLKVSLKKEGDGEGPGGGGRGGGKGSQGGGQGQFDEGMPQGGPGGPGPTGGYVDGGYAPHGGYGGPGGVPPPTGVPMQQQQVGGPMGGYVGPVGHIDGTAQQAGGPQ